MNKLQRFGKSTADAPEAETEESEANGDAAVVETRVAAFSSHPIQFYSIGGFHFENGVLQLYDLESLEKFEALLATLPARDRSLIKKINTEGIAKALEAAKKINGSVSTGITSTGDGA